MENVSMMYRTISIGLLGLLALASFLPTPAAANHGTCTNGSGSIWYGPVTGSNCIGTWGEVADLYCTQGVGHTSAGPVSVSGGRGYGCPVGVVVFLP